MKKHKRYNTIVQAIAFEMCYVGLFIYAFIK